MNSEVITVVMAIASGVLVNMGVLVAFRVSLEHRLTKLETSMHHYMGHESAEDR